LLSISIHGLWNASAIIAVYGALRVMVQNNMQLDISSALFVTGGSGMLILELVIMLFALPLINRSLRRSVVQVSPQEQNSNIISPISNLNTRETDGLDSKGN